jgi:dipeptidyl aminopeptidase/acylaminoacyl peptidase
MRTWLAAALLLTTAAVAEVPSNLVVENVPEFSPQLVEKVQPYLDSRTASFADWNPVRTEMLVRTRFGDTTQLHYVKMPGGARRQLTFYPDTVGGAGFRPRDPNTIVFSKDIGGNEFFQFYRYDVPSGAITLLTDGKSRNVGNTWSRDGSLLAYSSTKRTGKDTDIWVMDPMKPESARMVLQVEGGGWFATDISPDKSKLVAINYISANESQLYLVDVATGDKTLLTPKGKTPVAYSGAEFSADGTEIFFTSDEGSEFHQLRRMKLADRSQKSVVRESWDVAGFTLSDDRQRIAYVVNENAADRLKLLDLSAGKPIAAPDLPLGALGAVRWHSNGRLLGFSLNHAQSPTDAYSYDVTTGELVRWTESETGGLNPARNSVPQLITTKSFDGTPITAFLYRPDPKQFPGKRPVIVNIHGGPEGQAQPVFQGRSNYWINELGIAVIYPNVRGSQGWGKTFLAADNGFKREDTVRDIGAILDWIATDSALDKDRVAVYGGSYGGYMVLASMTMLGGRLKAGVDVVGISSFLTFLQNTSGYRRDLRRVEYGDERDPKMNAFLQQISPLTNAKKIGDPLFVIMGFNDPRVPYTEGEQIVKIVRGNDVPVWYLMARDEGHGFAKRKNQDYQFLAMTMFWQDHLLK